MASRGRGARTRTRALPYDPHELERRWRQRWEADATGLIPDLDAVPAGDLFYNLVEFPYPSAEGLHIGHVYKYSGADAFGRFQRMHGKQVPTDRLRRVRHPHRKLRAAGRPPPEGADRADD